MKKIWTFILFLTIIFIGISSQKGIAQTKGEVEAFYKGATLRIIVPNAPGGDYDLTARLIAPPLEKYTGARVIVENMPGAGGFAGGAYIYSIAKPDGLTVGLLAPAGMILGEILEMESVKYKTEGFVCVGRAEVMKRAVFASKASRFKIIVDMQKATKTIRLGTVDPTSSSTAGQALLIEAFGLNAEDYTRVQRKQGLYDSCYGRQGIRRSCYRNFRL